MKRFRELKHRPAAFVLAGFCVLIAIFYAFGRSRSADDLSPLKPYVRSKETEYLAPDNSMRDFRGRYVEVTTLELRGVPIERAMLLVHSKICREGWKETTLLI